MSVPAGKVPILAAARAALRFAVDSLGRLALPAALAAAPASLFSLVAGRAIQSGDLLTHLAAQLGVAAATAAFFAVALRLALFGSTKLGPEAAQDARRVFSSMAIIGFFLALVMMVAALPGMVMLGMLFEPHADALEAAQGDQAAVLKLVEQVSRESGGALAFIFVVYSAIWMALTSRVYLAAPASVGERRVMTFETWRWADGSVWRVAAARLLALVPAVFIIWAAQGAVGYALGVGAGDAASLAGFANANPIGYALLAFVTAFLSFVFYGATEAGLSAFLYRGLRPPDWRPIAGREED